eukprot:scaffold106240_cov19-Tisochrysis_lutea.AAC.1
MDVGIAATRHTRAALTHIIGTRSGNPGRRRLLQAACFSYSLLTATALHSSKAAHRASATRCSQATAMHSPSFRAPHAKRQEYSSQVRQRNRSNNRAHIPMEVAPRPSQTYLNSWLAKASTS